MLCNVDVFLYLEQHFSEVVQGEEFLGLSLQQVCSLISSDKLTVSTEEKVSTGTGSVGPGVSVCRRAVRLRASERVLFVHSVPSRYSPCLEGFRGWILLGEVKTTSVGHRMVALVLLCVS